MIRKLASIAAVVLASSALVVASAIPAQAGAGACSSTYFCGWFNLGYTGAGPYGTTGDNLFVGIVPNNQFTSVYNHGVSSNIRAYDGPSFSGSSVFVGRGAAISDLRTYGFNDRISSYYWL